MENKQINVDINKQESERCDYRTPTGDCGCPFFRKRTIIKRIPAILAATQTDQFMPFEFFACEKCGKPHRSTQITIPSINPAEAHRAD